MVAHIDKTDIQQRPCNIWTQSALVDPSVVSPENLKACRRGGAKTQIAYRTDCSGWIIAPLDPSEQNGWANRSVSVLPNVNGRLCLISPKHTAGRLGGSKT